MLRLVISKHSIRRNTYVQMRASHIDVESQVLYKSLVTIVFLFNCMTHKFGIRYGLNAGGSRPPTVVHDRTNQYFFSFVRSLVGSFARLCFPITTIAWSFAMARARDREKKTAATSQSIKWLMLLCDQLSRNLSISHHSLSLLYTPYAHTM